MWEIKTYLINKKYSILYWLEGILVLKCQFPQIDQQIQGNPSQNSAGFYFL